MRYCPCASDQARVQCILAKLDERSGIVAELAQGSLQLPSDNPDPNRLTAWFPTERVARAWRSLRRSEPLER